MCELLGISSQQAAPWHDPLTVFQQRGGNTADNPDGWGLAWRNATWKAFQAGELRVYRDGKLIGSLQTEPTWVTPGSEGTNAQEHAV